MKIRYYLTQQLLDEFSALDLAQWIGVSVECLPISEINDATDGLNYDPMEIAKILSDSGTTICYVDGLIMGHFYENGPTSILELEKKHPILNSFLDTYKIKFQCNICKKRESCITINSKKYSLPSCALVEAMDGIYDLISLICYKKIIDLDLSEAETLASGAAYLTSLVDWSPYPALIKYGVTKLRIREKARPKSMLRNWLTENCKRVKSAEDAIYNRYLDNSKNFPAVPMLIACRRWNSWTPNQPAAKKEKKITTHKSGGGYFLTDGLTNIAIDPGYGFIDMLYAHHDISVLGLDAVLISHDHPDHWSDLQNLLSLRFAYSRNCGKKLKIFLNESCHFLFERLVCYYSPIIDGGMPQKMHDGFCTTIGDIVVETLAMDHKEIFDKIDLKPIARSSSLGFKVKLVKEQEYVVAIPGDTSFPEDYAAIAKFAEFFAGADVACVHLGSLEEGWKTSTDIDADIINYGTGKHLGINGVISFINTTSPKIAIITEFGEELDINDSRLSINEIIKEMSLDGEITIIPSDVNLQVVFFKNQFLTKCHNCGEYIPASKVHISIEKKAGTITYEYGLGCKTGLAHYSKNEVMSYKSRQL